jgi:outer membrane protein assembly factor BamB
VKEQNFLAPFRLSCRRAEGGEVVWQSTDLPDYAGLDLAGSPLLAGGKLFIAAKSQASPQQQGQAQQTVLAIQPHDGKVIWKMGVGTFRQGQQYYYYGYREPTAQPQLVFRAGALYVDTHVGVLARLDAESGALDWGYGYQTDHVQGQGRFMVFGGSYPTQAAATGSSPPILAGDSLLIKGMQSGRLYAVEPNRMKVAWDRPIAKSSRLLGADDRALILGGPEISALDLETRALLWATPVPDGSTNGRVLVRPDGIWQLTPRGVFEIDPGSGRVRRIFRGNDLGSVGGDLFLTDRLLVAVSNRTISAYPRRKDTAEVSDANDPTTTKVRASND